MEQLFNQMVQFLARRGFFSGKLLVALDGSKLPTPKSYEGCGKRKQTRGPSRVGKTTLIRMLEERMASLCLARMQADPGLIPFASITTVGPEGGRFDWLGYYRAVLHSLTLTRFRRVSRGWS